MIKGIIKIFGADPQLVDDLLDLDSPVGFDEGDLPYDQEPL